jgi:hypothetical protein
MDHLPRRGSKLSYTRLNGMIHTGTARGAEESN